ncbi:MAG: tetratricopeptide repeat protein [Candidatus Atribacteria bacterium]|nr:tetratricopeptide repeat protein [Candidatus Atribacteria bacterium]MCD6350397.1 tetratricopeptide repeat protein [Candidatus Atribacteria bacterium]
MPIRILTSQSDGSLEDDFGVLLKRSNELIKEGRFGEAEKCLLRAREMKPDSPSVYNFMGFLAYQKKEFKEAVKSFKKALQVNPLYAEAWNNLGAAYLALSRFSDAKSAFEKAVGLNPNLEDALENLSWISEHFFANSIRFPTLSACVIMKNEERNIPRLLSSLREHVDEMVVVDTGSTDRSVEIARSYGARVYFHEWREDFSAAKNEALEKVQGEWILFLDADEEMRAEDLKKLRLILACAKQEAFMLPIKSFLDPQERTHMLNYLVRVFRNRPEIRYRGRVHETVEDSLFELGKEIFKLHHLFIYHHGYKDSGKTGWKVLSRNYELLLKEVEENPENVNALSYLGKTCLLDGRTEEARNYLEQVLALSKSFSFTVLSAHFDLARMALEEGNFDEALSHLYLVKEKEPYLPDLYYLLGLVYHRKGEYAKAIECFEKVLSVDHRKSRSLMVFFGISWGDLYQKMGECYLVEKEEEKAKECFEKANEFLNDDPNLLNNLAVSMVRLGDRKRAEAYFRKALEINPHHPDARSNLFRFLLEEGRIAEARALLSEMKELLGKQ